MKESTTNPQLWHKIILEFQEEVNQLSESGNINQNALEALADKFNTAVSSKSELSNHEKEKATSEILRIYEENCSKEKNTADELPIDYSYDGLSNYIHLSFLNQTGSQCDIFTLENSIKDLLLGCDHINAPQIIGLNRLITSLSETNATKPTKPTIKS